MTEGSDTLGLTNCIAYAAPTQWADILLRPISFLVASVVSPLRAHSVCRSETIRRIASIASDFTVGKSAGNEARSFRHKRISEALARCLAVNVSATVTNG